MRMIDSIEKKREGGLLNQEEIAFFVHGVTDESIPDYQISASLMAVFFQGLSPEETACLTNEMAHSGDMVDLSECRGITVDKHSTGGVGDKLSLVIQPLVAACGVCVPSLTGRGLGLTGGTADKLETIPGYSCSQPLDRFQEITKTVGVSMAVQTDEITPADKKLYALRDVTGTVASIPLIVGSILSKKLAEGAGTLVFDVKCGRGAFMRTPEDAKALAAALVAGAKAAGRKAAALVTDMNAPLGFAVGNANEVREALAILGSGRVDAGSDRTNDPNGHDKTLSDLCVELAAMMVSLAKEIGIDEARAVCREQLEKGLALEKFEEMVSAHGGDLERFERLLKKPTFKFKIQAMKSGFVSEIDAEKVARVALQLGAGREQTGDRIDPLAGVTLAVKVGDKVAVGAPLATLEKASDPDGLERAAADLFKAFTISPTAPEARSLILERID